MYSGQKQLPYQGLKEEATMQGKSAIVAVLKQRLQDFSARASDLLKTGVVKGSTVKSQNAEPIETTEANSEKTDQKIDGASSICLVDFAPVLVEATVEPSIDEPSDKPATITGNLDF